MVSAVLQSIGASAPGTGTDILQLLVVVAILNWVLTIPGMWLTFEKAGKPGWGAIVPFYNAYLLFEIAGRSGWTALTLLVPLLNVVMVLTAFVEIAQQFGKGMAYVVGLVVASPVFFGLLGFGSARYREEPGSA